MLQEISRSRSTGRTISHFRGTDMTTTNPAGGDFRITHMEKRECGRTYRWEVDHWREYLCGRPVATRAEMEQMDCPLPPEEDESEG